MDLKKIIRDIPDFPRKGIIFKDITTLLKDKDAFKESIDLMADFCGNKKIDKIVSMESRGFIFGSVLAYKLNCGFVPIRKKGKLPHETIRVSYELEYGTDVLEMHKDAIEPGENVLLVDDLLATGGTAQAVVKLINQVHGKIAGLVFLIELEFLKGREKLKGNEIFSLIKY